MKEVKVKSMIFENVENAKAYYENKLGKYDKEFVMVLDKLVLLCGTPLAFDEEVDNLMIDAFEHVFIETLGLEWQNGEIEVWDYVRPIANEFIKQMCDYGEFSVEYINEEF